MSVEISKEGPPSEEIPNETENTEPGDVSAATVYESGRFLEIEFARMR